MKRRGGFTSVELIVVLEIIGILFVIAAVIFFNLQSNARQVSIENLKAAMENAASVVYGKAALVGVEQIDKAQAFDIETAYGYPSIEGIVQVVEDFNHEWVVIERNMITKKSISVSFKNLDPMAQRRCYLTYTQPPNANTRPHIEVFCDD